MAPRLPQDFFAIAGKAPCDVKTAKNYFDPKKRAAMKPSVKARVSLAVRACGFTDPAATREENAA